MIGEKFHQNGEKSISETKNETMILFIPSLCLDMIMGLQNLLWILNHKKPNQ